MATVTVSPKTKMRNVLPSMQPQTCQCVANHQCSQPSLLLRTGMLSLDRLVPSQKAQKMQEQTLQQRRQVRAIQAALYAGPVQLLGV